VTGAIAAALATSAAVGLSALGPFGVAGQAEIDPGIVIDDQSSPSARWRSSSW